MYMIVNLRQNGFGLSYNAGPDADPTAYEPWFDDAGQQLEALINDGAQVLGGEPGAGKSHIAADMFQAADAAGMASHMLASHINAGSMAGREETQAMLTRTRDAGEEGLLVIDNFDFMLYTGARKRRRSDAKVREYAGFLGPAVLDCHDAGCKIVATVHSDEWRDNHSQAPEEAKRYYADLVDNLGGETVFTGAISQANAERLLLRREVDPDLAADIAAELARVDGLLFRQAHHINPLVFAEAGIEAAVTAVNQLRDQKIAGGA